MILDVSPEISEIINIPEILNISDILFIAKIPDTPDITTIPENPIVIQINLSFWFKKCMTLDVGLYFLTFSTFLTFPTFLTFQNSRYS